MEWIFEPSEDIEQADDNHVLKGTKFSVQVCTFGGMYSVNEDLLDTDGTWVNHKEFKMLDDAIAFAEKKATK
tara:strand:- start:152 stop:367 length:216 start_codon:yes stop_codon:yes gene_type:complete